MFRVVWLLPLLFLVSCVDGQRAANDSTPGSEFFRAMTLNIEDVRTADLSNRDHPRLKHAADIIQTIRPDILLLSEVAYDYEGVPGYDVNEGEGANGGRLIANFLATPERIGGRGIDYRYFAAPTNTGVSSGYDLDNSGEAVSMYPNIQSSSADGSVPRQTAAERSYGNDSWGFGVFPGQYGMLLLVNPDIDILREEVRTFQKFKWSAMPGALIPADDSGNRWYTDTEWGHLRLSSKSHWDVPVRLRNGAVLHLLLSHPTPPAFDGPEGRNKKRNHDEVRFWGDYINGDNYIVDDNGVKGGLAGDAQFIIMGDLNSDLDEGSSIDNPVGRYLIENPRVNGSYVPYADSAGQVLYPRLDADDTAQWGLRVDYVIPSTGLRIRDGRVERQPDYSVSDHFPVWIDLEVPPLKK